MANQHDHSPWRNRLVLRSAAVFVALYAIAAAWIVATNGEDPAPLRLDRTDDGAGVVVSGAVSDEDQRAALIDALSSVTDAPVIIARIVLDPDAEPVDAPLDIAAALAAELESDDG